MERHARALRSCRLQRVNAHATANWDGVNGVATQPSMVNREVQTAVAPTQPGRRGTGSGVKKRAGQAQCSYSVLATTMSWMSSSSRLSCCVRSSGSYGGDTVSFSIMPIRSAV